MRVQTYLTPRKSNPVYWLHFFDKGKCQKQLFKSILLRYLTFWKSDKIHHMLGVTHVQWEVFNLSLIKRMSKTNLKRRFWGALIFSPGTKFWPFLTSFFWISWAALRTKSSLELYGVFDISIKPLRSRWLMMFWASSKIAGLILWNLWFGIVALLFRLKWTSLPSYFPGQNSLELKIFLYFRCRFFRNSMWVGFSYAQLMSNSSNWKSSTSAKILDSGGLMSESLKQE